MKLCGFEVGLNHPFILLAGPCVIESEQLVLDIAGKMKEVTDKLGIPYIFKASYDKANRSSDLSFRGPGMQNGLRILEEVRRQIGVPVVTDVHTAEEVPEAAAVVDLLQTPAFLCRQTDFIVACARSGKPVNIKKGQFLAPQDMKQVVLKARHAAKEAGLDEDSVQLPGGQGTSSGGKREFVPPLARAAAAVGVSGFFMETHPNPCCAKSDGPNMVPLDKMEELLTTLKQIDTLVKTGDQFLENQLR